MIREAVSITGINATGTTSNDAQLYIESTLYLDNPGEGIILEIPSGILITVENGGSITSYAPSIQLGDGSALYVMRGGEFNAGTSILQFPFSGNEGTVVNSGRIGLYQFYLRNRSFYNLTTGTATVCIFNAVNAEVLNTGTFVNCAGIPYDDDDY